MKELNPILYSLNDIDARYLAEPKRKKRPAALYIAAAAAAMTLLTGFTVRVLTSDTPGVNLGYENLFNYNLVDKKDLNILTREELREMGAIERGDFDHGIYTFLFQGVLPSEIFKLYNAAPVTLGNDNFTEEPCDVYVHGMFDTDNFEFGDLSFDYKLTYKTGAILDMCIGYSVDGYQPVLSIAIDRENQVAVNDVIELNDGSKCLILGVKNKGCDDIYGSAEFSYNGAMYSINTLDTTVGMVEVKQILADLGVL